MAGTDRLTKFFADLDAVLAVLATPENQIAELKLRLRHNKRCKDYLASGNYRVGVYGAVIAPNYNAFDLTAIDCGLVGRLIDAEARAADAALTAAAHKRGAALADLLEQKAAA